MQGWKKTALIVASCGLIVAMAAVWVWADLGTADGTASVVGAGAGVVGLAYALISGGGRPSGPVVTATRTGRATAGNGGTANTGVTLPAAGARGRASAEETGDAEADGPGDANTGVRFT